MFYINKVKTIPLDIENYIAASSLAYWAMDDGSKAGSGFHYNTQGLTIEEVTMLSNILLNKFKLINTIQKHRNGYRIYISSKSMDNFRALVTPYFHSSMMYKLN